MAKITKHLVSPLQITSCRPKNLPAIKIELFQYNAFLHFAQSVQRFFPPGFDRRNG